MAVLTGWMTEKRRLKNTTSMLNRLYSALFLLSLYTASAQTIGKTSTEDYTAEFEKQASIYSIPEYNGEPVPVAVLSIGVNEEVLSQYPELGDYRVGLGLTNITIAFLEETFRFEFVDNQVNFFINYIVDDKLKLSTSLKCHFQEFNNRSLLLSFIRMPFFTFKTACFIASGLMNWPFLRLTTFPVFAAATTRSVWRTRNAGI